MTPERWQQVTEIFHAALAREPSGREAFLAEACRTDARLWSEVHAMLAAHEDAGPFGEALPFASSLSLESSVGPGVASLAGGSRLGPYQILGPLGAGGMGQVYKAVDPRLHRDVAIKVLPPVFTTDPERLARFEREACVLAALNHPHIGAIYGLEESDGIRGLVLELVEGATLADRLKNGPVPVAEALSFGKQIAEALEAAHDRGIIHRDLKPANVKVTPEGQVKVLDFGLAKAIWGTTERQDLSQRSTMTGLDSGVGHVVGTPPYMSPEQAQGREVDKRTDIWAFGCLLYELLTGKRAFQSDTLSDTIRAVLEREPDWSAVPANTPARIRELLRQCLQKDRTSRWSNIADARRTIVDALLPASAGETRRVPPFAAAFVMVALVAVGVVWWVRRPAAAIDRLASAPLRLATFTQLTDQPGEKISVSLSPDGHSFVYASRSSSKWDVYSQRVGEKNPVNLTKDSPADDTQPAFSPDGERIAFRSERDGGGIFVMSAMGEAVKRITNFGYNPAWSPDGSEIVCASTQLLRPDVRLSFVSQLFTVNISSGEKRLITPQVDYAMQPHWSPHGYRIAYWGVRDAQWDIWTIPASGGEPVPITDDAALDWNPVWSPDGSYLYFASDRGGSMNLWRAPIDEKSGRASGELEPVTTPSSYSAWISFAHTGDHMAYVQRTYRSNIYRVGFDPVRETTLGQPASVTQGARTDTAPDISPDGEWLALNSQGGKREDLFIVRKDGSGLRQLTDDMYRKRNPTWSPDGGRIAFYSDRSGKFEIWTIHPDGSGLQRLSDTQDGYVNYPSWSPDGSRLVFGIQNRTPLVIAVDKPWASQSPQPLAVFNEADTWFAPSRWSPDGRRLAGFQARTDGTFTGVSLYSFETGQYDRITNFGGYPRWLSDGRRLLFHSYVTGKIHLVDSQSRRVHEVLSGPPDEMLAIFSISSDDRWIYFTRQVVESDIWVAALEEHRQAPR